MHRFALAALLALSLIGLSGCGTKSTPSTTEPTSVSTSSTATASAEATTAAAPGSAAWKEDVTRYFSQFKAVADKDDAAGQALINVLNAFDKGEPSKAQIAKLTEASKTYPQLITDAQAIIPPEELKAYHALWLQTLAGERDTMAATADAIAKKDLAKIENAEKLFNAAAAAQSAQEAELKRFNTAFGTSYK